MAADPKHPERLWAKRRQELFTPSLVSLANLVRRTGNIAYELELGLSPLAWRVIAQLAESGTQTQSELAEIAQIDRGQLSRTTAQMIDQGLIERLPRTWRSHEIRLTAHGCELANRIREIARLRNVMLATGIPKAELQSFMRVLERMTENARVLLEGELAKLSARK